MNPYEASSAVSTPRSNLNNYRASRLAFYLCALVTSFAMPLSAFLIAGLVNSTFKPNMGTWVIPYFFLTAVLCMPIGIFTAIVTRWSRRRISRSPLYSILSAIVMGFLPVVLIPALKNSNAALSSLSFAAQQSLLLFWTAGAPIFLGATAYLLIAIKNPPDDDGSWPAPNYWNE